MFSRSFLSMYISSSWRRQEGKHEGKVWSVCACTRACMTAPPTCRLLTVSFSRKCRRTSAGSSIRQFHRICWATALTEGTTQYNKVRVGCHSICPHHIHTHSCCTITWETNSTHSRMAVTDQTRLDRMGRDWVGYREFEDVTDGNIRLC